MVSLITDAPAEPLAATAYRPGSSGILRCDEAYIAEARPSLIGLAWQLWPDMQSYLEEHAHWIQETPEGDPRKSWKDGWEGFDPSLSPEGFVDDEEKDDLDGDL